MIYRVTASALALTMATATAFAGGVAQPQPAPVLVPSVTPAPVDTGWTGFYVGGQLEYGDVTADDNGTTEDGSGPLYGVFAGYRYDFGTYVVGAELDLMAADIDLDQNLDVNVDRVYRLGLEVGYDAGPALIYGTAGYAYAEASGIGGAPDVDGDGYFFGIGIDYLVTDNVTVGAELLQHQFDDFADTPGLDVDATTIGVNVAYNF